MIEYIEQIISTTLFLSLMLLLRAVFYNRISKRLCYAMWLVVVVYLLASFGKFSNSFQVLNVIYRAVEAENGSWDRQEAAGTDRNAQETWDKVQSGKQESVPHETAAFGQVNQVVDQQEQSQKDCADDTAPIRISDAGQELWTEGVWLKRIWIAGCVICAIIFAGSNLHFAVRLQKSRKRMETDEKFRKKIGRGDLSVYQTKEINTPCLFGVVCPAIYLPEMQLEPEKCHYVLAHEYTHYRHGDPMWAVLRCLCVSLYWYHPLVWMAALLSGRDSESACDESVIRTYDAKARKAYGETLILFGTGGRDFMRLFAGASGMNGRKQELKKRITLIASQRKQHIGTAVLACVLLLGVTGCTIGSPVVPNDGSVSSDENSSHIEEVTQTQSGELSAEAGGDLVPKPYDFAGKLDKTKENGIEYYNVITEKEIPLPLNEWAKMNLFTEQGNAIDAYVRFTQVIRDVEEIKDHIDHYVEAREIKEPFGMLETDDAQCVLLQYEILVAGDARLDDTDRIPSMALDFPLKLYSTMESGRFANYQGIERTVRDLSIVEQDKIEPGDTIKKEVICFIPREYTAYGMELVYMTAHRTTGTVYFKPEYE